MATELAPVGGGSVTEGQGRGEPLKSIYTACSEIIEAGV